MVRRLCIVVVTAVAGLAAIPPTSARAGGGVNLLWNSCAGGGGVSTKTFACNTNLGNSLLYGSMVPDHAWDEIFEVSARIDVIAEGGSFPDWWQFYNAGSCRQTSLGFTMDVSDEPSCTPAWGGTAPFSGTAGYASTGPASRQWLGAGAIVQHTGEPLSSGVDYLLFRMTINNAKTVGTCAGCSTPMSLILSEVHVLGYVSGDDESVDEFLTTPAQNACVTWQANAGPCGATPARNRTWGQMKSLYR